MGPGAVPRSYSIDAATLLTAISLLLAALLPASLFLLWSVPARPSHAIHANRAAATRTSATVTCDRRCYYYCWLHAFRRPFSSLV